MKKVLFLYVGLLVTFATTLQSCVEEQDFDQIDDLEITPVVASSLFYVEATEQTINDETNTTFYSQDINFDAFSEEYVSDHILEGTLTYEIENTTSKSIVVQIDFLDANGTILDSELFSVNPAPTALIAREVNYGAGGKSIEIIRNTSAFRISASNLGDNSSVSSEQNPVVILRSSAAFMIGVR